MRKSWVREALGKGGATNALPPGNRIGPTNKVRSFNPGKTSGNEVNATVDARIGSGPKVNFDVKNRRTPINIAAPTSERRSSGKKGPSKYT